MHAGDVDSTHAEAFAKQARLFCDFVEHAATMPLEQRLLVARDRLLELTLTATRLPIVEPPEGFEAGARLASMGAGQTTAIIAATDGSRIIGATRARLSSRSGRTPRCTPVTSTRPKPKPS